MSVKDFNERFLTSVPEADEYDTLSGFLNKLAGRIPELNEELKTESLSFTIVKKSQRRIRQVKVKKLDKSTQVTVSPPPK
jgi:CBS domain containing-hemolysin-like protein